MPLAQVLPAEIICNDRRLPAKPLPGWIYKYAMTKIEFCPMGKLAIY